MPEEICPFNTLGRVHYQHAPYDVLHLRVHFMRKDYRVFFDALEQIDDVGSRVRHSKCGGEYLPKSSS